MIDANIRIIKQLKQLIFLVKENESVRTLFFNGENSFKRNRSLPLERLISFILNMPKKSLNIEIPEFFNAINLEKLTCTKSAFSIQRQKLKYIFFAWLNASYVNSFYSNYGNNVKRWRGFRLMAVDGSTAYLINKPEVVEHFGVQANHHTSVAMGQIMSIYDVLNEVVVSSVLLPIKTSEPEIANGWIQHIEDDMLVIYDRGFPSFISLYLHLHQEREKKFIMRCKIGFNNEVSQFVKSSKQQEIVEFRPTDHAISQLKRHGFKITSKERIKVRLIKVQLDKGIEPEILITNLWDATEYPARIFKELYFKRWGIETFYDKIKNKIQLESFSGYKVNSILQDFYATILIANLQTLITKQCEEKVDSLNKRRKFTYKVNANISIGMMKNRIIHLFLTQNPEEILAELGDLFLKYLEQIRPDRTYERTTKFKRLKGKYQTLTNYKRAA